MNGALNDAAELVNKDPYGEGWLIKIKISDPAELDELLSSEEYSELVGV
jgi:glycine cleavage system H protein